MNHVDRDRSEAPVEQAAPDADRAWRVRMICCGRDAGAEMIFGTWDEADQFRESWTSGPAVDPHGYSGDGYHGHQRAGIIEAVAPDADRVSAYAERLLGVWMSISVARIEDTPQGHCERLARAVIALADREQEPLLARIARQQAFIDAIDSHALDGVDVPSYLASRILAAERALLQGGQTDGVARRAAIAALAGPAEPEASETGGAA